MLAPHCAVTRGRKKKPSLAAGLQLSCHILCAIHCICIQIQVYFVCCEFFFLCRISEHIFYVPVQNISEKQVSLWCVVAFTVFIFFNDFCCLFCFCHIGPHGSLLPYGSHGNNIKTLRLAQFLRQRDKRFVVFCLVCL